MHDTVANSFLTDLRLFGIALIGRPDSTTYLVASALNCGRNFLFFADSQLAGRIPMGKVVGPEAAIGPAILLASEASSWVTGHLLPVDGGYLAL